MHILFDTYPTAFLKPGGGEKQLSDYYQLLKNLSEYNVELFNQWNVEKKKFDIIHYFSTMPGSLTTIDILKKHYGAALVISPNFWVDIKNWNASGVYDEIKTMLWLADKVIVNSQVEKENLYKYMNDCVAYENIAVVHNMYSDVFLERVDENLFRQQYSIQSPFILQVGNVEERKNQLNFLKALVNFPEYKFVCIGGVRGETYFQKCKEVAGDNFIHINPLQNADPLLRSAYAGCDFFAMPSTVETPSISALEAAVSGAKILITKVGSTTEYFQDQAVYVDPFDMDSLKKGIENIQKKMKNQVLAKYIEEHFSIRVVSQQLESVYIDVMKSCKD